MCSVCSWHSPRASRLVLQDQVSRQARCCQWNEKVRNSLAGTTAIENLQGNLCGTSSCSMLRCAWCCSVKAMLSVQAGFQISNTFMCSWHTWTASSPALAVPHYLLWSYIKSMAYKIHPANTDDLQQGILECFQGIPHEMLQCVMIPFLSWLQKCNEWHSSLYKVSYSNSNY